LYRNGKRLLFGRYKRLHPNKFSAYGASGKPDIDRSINRGFNQMRWYVSTMAELRFEALRARAAQGGK
jgi:hypothetical protein